MKSSSFNEIRSAVRDTDYWIHLAFFDIKRKYTRATLGYLWSLINSVLFIAIVGTCYTLIFKVNAATLLPHLAISYFTWQYIVASVNESASLLHTNAIILKTSRITAPMLIMRTISKNTIILVQNALLSLLVIVYFQELYITSGLSVVGVLLIIIAVAPLCFAIALVTSRFRDVEQIIQNILTMLFFVTPVLWYPDIINLDSKWFVNWNPLFHFLELVRGPMLGNLPTKTSYLVVIGFVILLNIVAAVLYSRVRTRLALWI